MFKQLFVPLTTKKAALVIGIIGFFVFGNALFNGFVWDDLSFILKPDFGHTFNPTQLFGPNQFNVTGYYRPIPAVYFALLYAVANSQAFLYHFIQIALHIINTVLVFLLLRSLLNINKKMETDEMDTEQVDLSKFSGSQRVKYLRKHGLPRKTVKTITNDPRSDILSFFLSLIFLVHPINVESVAYIAATQSELLFLFGMSALLLSINRTIRGAKIFYIAGLILLSLLTKETGFLFLLMILGFQILFYRKRVLEFLLFEFIALGIYLYFRFEIGKVFFGYPYFNYPIPIDHLSLLERVINMPLIFWYYLQTLFFPLHLTINQLWIITHLSFQSFYLPLFLDMLFIGITCFGGVYLYRHQKHYFRLYTLFFLWFYFGVGMLLQIFPLDETVSDRWFYFPFVGLLGMFGTWVYVYTLSFSNHNKAILEKYKKMQIYIPFCCVILLVLLSARTIIRNTNYHDDLTLKIHDAQIENNEILELDIGTALLSQKKYNEAYPHLQRSVNIFPYITNLQELGRYYEVTGNAQKAKEYYYKSIDASKTASAYHYFDIDAISTYDFLAYLYLRDHDYKEAASVSKMGIQQFHHSGLTSALQKILTRADDLQNTTRHTQSIFANPCSQTGDHEIAIGNAIINSSLLKNWLCKYRH